MILNSSFIRVELKICHLLVQRNILEYGAKSQLSNTCSLTFLIAFYQKIFLSQI